MLERSSGKIPEENFRHSTTSQRILEIFAEDQRHIATSMRLWKRGKSESRRDSLLASPDSPVSTVFSPWPSATTTQQIGLEYVSGLNIDKPRGYFFKNDHTLCLLCQGKPSFPLASKSLLVQRLSLGSPTARGLRQGSVHRHFTQNPDPG